MIGLNVLFWIFVALFAIIGLTRGWAKELLVTFSVILALFIISVLERFVPFFRDNPVLMQGATYFWVRAVITIALVFFGYQGPNIPKIAATQRFVRERFQDSFLGVFLGAINGYLVFGSLWYYLNQANHPFPFILPPPAGTETAASVERLLSSLPPAWLNSPTIYFAVAIAFIFVLVVFI